MIYSIGDSVVIYVNGTYKVGVVLSRLKIKKGWVYSAKLENGKTLDRVAVNKELAQYTIHRGLTKQFNNDNR